MPIDKSPPWKAVSWAEKYPNDPVDPPEWAASGLQYWMVETTAGYTVSAEWMTEEQARTIAAAPDLKEALEDLISDAERQMKNPSHHTPFSLQKAKDALAKASVSP